MLFEEILLYYYDHHHRHHRLKALPITGTSAGMFIDQVTYIGLKVIRVHELIFLYEVLF